LFNLSPVDRDSDRAYYRQIIDQIRSAIEDGRLGPRDQLPPEAEMCESAGVSRGTLRQALLILKTEGLIVSEQGKGWFVRGT
jgi:GntR family transcriptional regulator